MIGVVILVTGIGIGAMLTCAVQATWRVLVEQPRRLDPPRAIARLRRGHLLDIRLALDRRPYVPPESVGVRVVRGRTPIGEPPNVPLRDVREFDEEHTQ